jgi:hypothetical protein
VTEETFGPYRIDALIGRGGMGEVHRAFDTVRGRVVALKRLPAGLAADPEFGERFRTESALAARLREPHIIPIHDYGEIDGQLFIDMRLVEGTDLATLLAADGPLAPRRAVDIVAQIAAALDTAHAEGLVHRDIKPANVLVSGVESDADGEFVYVADFGIARAVSDASTSLTATGTTVGSMDYMAPERFAGGHGDHRVDVYALGCLLFEVLTARKPFAVEGVPAIINAHLNTPPSRPSEFVPGLPVGLDAVVARAMAKDPDDRYSGAGELATAARAAAAGAMPAAATTSTALPGGGLLPASGAAGGGAAGPSRYHRRRGLVVLSAVAAVLAIIGGVTLGFGEPADPSEIIREPFRTPGDNPFMPPVGTDRPNVTPPARSGGPFGGDTSGLYGGTLNNAACDPDGMSAFLQAHPDKAAAWAQVQGIPPDRIPSYVARLTPVILRSDTAVTNHGFRNGRATPFQAVLQAGTAVLVDEYGVPRAKCYCGNPLTPPVAISQARYGGRSWSGFSPTAITTIRPAAAPIAEFTLVDPSSGQVFIRPAGSRGGSDRLASPPASPPDPTQDPTQDPTTQPFTAEPTTGQALPDEPGPRPGATEQQAQPPAAPTGLSATPVGPDAVELRWTDNSGGDATYTATDGTAERSVPDSESRYTWAGLDPDTRVCFQVIAYSTAGSTPSDQACAVTPSVGSAPVITGYSTYQEGVLVYLSIRYADADGDAAGWGFRGANGSGWGQEDRSFSNPTYDRLSPGRIDYPFNHACGESRQFESDVEAWVYDSEGRESSHIVAHLACSGGVG